MSRIQSPSTGDPTASWEIEWRCPHCKDRPRALLEAAIHIAGAHADCPSCAIEHLVLRHLLDSHGEFYLAEFGE